ncbi:MAG: nickel-dependent hydrogenase large subunit [Rhodocyclales bacterium]|nr:nickel-dependent hydrogenase large subunit [Rhodocyclales bacterium]
MIAEGKLEFEIAWDGRRIVGAKVLSSRPVLASRVLEGKGIGEALRRVPLLFSICGRAQGVAAAAACEAARGVEADGAVKEDRERAIAAECLQEYVWRLFIDLPQLLGEAARPGDLADLRRRMPAAAGEAEWLDIAEDAEALLEQRVFGMRARDWLALDTARRARWVDDAALPAARMLARLRTCRVDPPRDFLPWLDAEALRTEIAPALEASPAFVAKPAWRGRPAETGALARQRLQPHVARELELNGLSARLLARLTELAALPAQLRRPLAQGVRSISAGAGIGIAAVETARGTLIHRAALDGERVAHYRILAPTEWNFHPRGAFPRGLAGMPARNEGEARQAAALLAHALDPCVAYETRIVDA